MKKHRLLFVLPFFTLCFLSCTDGYYHPDIPDYTPKDSIETTLVPEYEIIQQQNYLLKKSNTNLNFYFIFRS